MLAPKPSSCGFTLFDLQVITVVLALLAVLFFPIATRIRDQAYPTLCSANIQQYSHAFLMYLQDYDETFPGGMKDTLYQRGELIVTSWDLLLQSYLKEARAARCPSDPYPAFYEFANGTRVWRSYTTPRNLIWGHDPNNPRDSLYPMRLATVTQPAGTLMLLEKNQGLEVNGRPYPMTTKPPCWLCASAIENYQQCAWERHGERIHMLFVDGHLRVLAGKRPGPLGLPANPSDPSFHWPHLEGYVFRPGVGTAFDLQANGDQLWEFCPIPGEEPNQKCLPQ